MINVCNCTRVGALGVLAAAVGVGVLVLIGIALAGHRTTELGCEEEPVQRREQDTDNGAGDYTADDVVDSYEAGRTAEREHCVRLHGPRVPEPAPV